MLEVLRSRGTVTISDLARLLGVSEMTVHRDLRQLESQGLVQRVFGGATLARPQGAAFKCGVCGAPVEKRLDFVVELTSGDRLVACCPHCGLMLLHRAGSSAETAVTFDFLSRQTVNAKDATYLVDCSVGPCCVPSVLVFNRREEAEAFRSAFGGALGDLGFALEWLSRVMGLGGLHR